jgi:hypothetical protein
MTPLPDFAQNLPAVKDDTKIREKSKGGYAPPAAG